MGYNQLCTQSLVNVYELQTTVRHGAVEVSVGCQEYTLNCEDFYSDRMFKIQSTVAVSVMSFICLTVWFLTWSDVECSLETQLWWCLVNAYEL